MNCPKCNTEIPEGCACPVCAKAHPIKSRSEFVTKHGSSQAKQYAFLTRILGCVFALVFIIGAFITPNLSITDLPILSPFFEEDGVEDIMDFADPDEFDDFEDYMDDFIDEYEDDITKKQEKQLRDYVKTVEKCAKKPSINNLKKYYKDTKAAIKTVALIENSDEERTLERFEDSDIRIAITVFNVFSIASWIFAIILAFLSLRAGQKLSSGRAITAIIVSIFPGLALVGFLHFLITTAGLICIVILSNKIKAEQKAFYTGVAL